MVELKGICKALYFLSVIAVAALPGCATNPLQGARFWTIDQCAQRSSLQVSFPGADGGVLAMVPRAYCSSAKRAIAKISSQMGFGVDTLYIASPKAVNGFATRDKNGKSVVIVTMGMLQAIGEDEAAWAGLFGHEIAHHVRHHGEGRAEAKSGAQAGGQALGNVIAQLIPGVGGFVAGNAANFVVANAMYGAYTRPQEAEADDLGLQSMVAAGYDPRGMLKLLNVLRKQREGAALPAFLSTHPGVDDRIGAVEAFIAQASGASAARQRATSAPPSANGGVLVATMSCTDAVSSETRLTTQCLSDAGCEKEIETIKRFCRNGSAGNCVSWYEKLPTYCYNRSAAYNRDSCAVASSFVSFHCGN